MARRSGGGITSKNLVHKPVRVGKAAQGKRHEAVAQIGGNYGNHSTDTRAKLMQHYRMDRRARCAGSWGEERGRREMNKSLEREVREAKERRSAGLAYRRQQEEQAESEARRAGQMPCLKR